MPVLFRDVALENLDSSEHLDHVMQVTTSGRWLVVAGFSLIFAAAFVWGFFGSVQSFAEGSGWILDPDNEGSAFSARIFLPEHMRSKLHQGLPVWLESANFPMEHHGYLVGEVVGVQRISARERTELAEWKSIGASIQPEADMLDVRVSLKRAENGTVGVWTLEGSEGKVPLPKSPVKAKVILAERRPVDFLWQSRLKGNE